jgi:hypothetical protein
MTSTDLEDHSSQEEGAPFTEKPAKKEMRELSNS